MLPKHLYPHLNRQQRRHINRNKEWVIPKGGANWLLAGLLMCAGFWRLPEPLPNTASSIASRVLGWLSGRK